MWNCGYRGPIRKLYTGLCLHGELPLTPRLYKGQLYCWNQTANILWKNSASLFMKDIGLQFSFLVMSLSHYDIRACCPHKMSWVVLEDNVHN